MTEISFPGNFSQPHATESLARQFQRYHAQGDWRAVTTMLADDLVVHDMRVLVGRPVHDGDALTAVLDRFGEVGGDLLAVRIVAERGHRHALAHVELTYPPHGEQDLLLAMECSEEGQVSKLELFDGGELADAGRALAQLHLASLPDDHAATVELGARLMDAVWTRDLATIEALMDDDLTHVDHRQDPPLTLDRDETLDLVASVLGADPDVVDLVTEMHRISHRGVVASRTQTRARAMTTLRPDIVLLGVRDGRIDLVEFYPEGDGSKALARLQLLETG